MKHINLDMEDERVQRFVRSLPVDPDGSVLEIQGEAILQVFPVGAGHVDLNELKAAIISRRVESRELNAEWQNVDRETWQDADRSKN